MGAYHQCCNTQTETIRWYAKGSGTYTGIVTHIALDAQSLLPRKVKPATPADGSFSPTTAFGFRIGGKDHTDTLKNPERRIGIRVWKAIDGKGRIIPNAYIIANDYLGTDVTNYDYNDNMYYVSNIRPEIGTASFSELGSTPSSVDFGERLLQSSNTLTLNLKNLGQTYANGSSDPSIVINSIAIIGENRSEFTVGLPSKLTLNPQDLTTLTIGFNPKSEGLKIADLLIYYNNALSPYRVPLYGIAKASGTTVNVHYRINSGATKAITLYGKTWRADTLAFDNLEPYTNAKVTKIAATDDDLLYLDEQSSNADKRPFRYEIPLPNGEYVVRLHFAEIYWGAPGAGVSKTTGARVMSVNLENQLRVVNFDPVQEVGTMAALIKNLPVTVADGKLNINFTASVNRPMVSAIEIYSFKSGTTLTKTSTVADTGTMATNALISMQTLSDSVNVFEKSMVYPNPVYDKFYIRFPAIYSGTVTLQLADVPGRTYELGRSRLKAGGSNVAVDVKKLNLKPGVYFLKILSNERKPEIIKLLIE